MKIWVDDAIPAPESWTWCKTSNEAIKAIQRSWDYEKVTDISLDDFAGDRITWGGDYIHILYWMDYISNGPYAHIFSKKINTINFYLHGTDFKETRNMREIIQKNNWNLIE